MIVITGLLASGKTTVGRLLSQELALPLIDKDTILEALFDALGCRDRSERTRLSRASDEVLFSLAGTAVNPVLVNWWDHDSAPSRLLAIRSAIVEVFCDCPVEMAAARFEAPERHVGHHDSRRSPVEVEQDIDRVRDTYRGPLSLGCPLVRVDTGGNLDRDAVVSQVRTAVAGLLPSK